LAASRDSGIPVFAVGLSDAAEAELRELAGETGGRYVALRQASGFEIAAQVEDAQATSTVSPTPRAARPPGVPASVPNRVGLLIAILAAGLALAAASLLMWLVRRRSATAASAATPARRAPRQPAGAGASDALDQAAAGTVLMPHPEAPPVEKTVLLSQQAWLKMREGPAPGTVFTLSDRATASLGRSPGNEILLDDHSVSGQHCRIRPEGGSFVLHDLGSTNGTFVNEERVEQKALRSGDEVRIGTIRLAFGIGTPPH
jgi:hypothetical protein